MAYGESLDRAIRDIIERNLREVTLSESGSRAVDELVLNMVVTTAEEGISEPLEDRRVQRALTRLDRRLGAAVRRYRLLALDQVDDEVVDEISRGLCPMPPICKGM